MFIRYNVIEAANLNPKRFWVKLIIPMQVVISIEIYYGANFKGLLSDDHMRQRTRHQAHQLAVFLAKSVKL